ncbi:patatin-like phospholipase family protein [Glaciecola sp. SC05]|uniref:patatin-like phospholipase family protein n=1 Tax=Glaciecola sp. SC05 TaxID=1987355 RepID=UPI0035296020
MPTRELSTVSIPYVSLPNGQDPLDPSKSLNLSTLGPSSENVGIFAYHEQKRGHALNILQISGGGQYGAFGAGFLNAWQATGMRPEFDIVTGVSAGALTATHAFLGSPEDDKVISDIFTSIDKKNIYKRRTLLRVLMGSDSLFDTTPLEELLKSVITPEVLMRVAAAADDNRQLWVGTTNLDYNQTWAWNMTLIAQENKPGALDLYRKVLLASASMPVAFPPVEIDGHLFADGGIRANILVHGLVENKAPKAPLYEGGNVFVIHNEPRTSAPAPLQPNLQGIASTVFAQMMSASVESVLLRSYYSAKAHGYQFNMVDIPDDVPVGKNPLAFDKVEMKAAFDAGVAAANESQPWQHTPPNMGDYPDWAL